MSAAAPPHQRPITAALLRLGAAAALSLMFAIVKLAAARGVNLVESLFWRQGFALLPVGIWILFGPGIKTLQTHRPAGHFVRMLMGLSAMGLNFLAMMLMPMAEATVISFSVPLFATLAAVLFLGERPGRWRWSALAIGFLGVLIVMQPTTAMLHNSATLIALTGAAMTAAVAIQIRNLSMTEPPATVVFWFSATSLLPLGIAMFWFAAPHDLTTWGLLLAMGLVGGCAQILLTSALRLGPVALVLPMDYSSLIWAVLLGWQVFGNIPGPMTWLGAPIIIISGLIILWREQIYSKRSTSSADTL